MRSRINHNGSIALERSVIMYLGEGGGNLNRFYVYTDLAIGSAVVHKHFKHKRYSVRVKDSNSSKHQISKLKIQY